MKGILKSKKIRIGIVLLLVIIALTFSVRSIFTRVIRAPAYFSGRNIEFKIMTTAYMPLMSPPTFKTGKSLEQLEKAILKWDPDAKVEIQENNMFISSLNPDTGKRDYYYIYKSNPENEKYYGILDLGTWYSEDRTKSDSYHLDFIVPYYMFREDSEWKPSDFYEEGQKSEIFHYIFGENYVWNPSNYHHGEGQKYEMLPGRTIEDVYEFYKESG